MKAHFIRFCCGNAGATSIEYAIIAGGIAVVIVTAVNGVGGTVQGLFNNVLSALK